MSGLVLPTEILFDVLLHVDPKEIKNMCATNPMYAAICKDDHFRKLYARKWNVVQAMDPSEVLPDETMLEILLNADPKEIKNLCATNKRYAELCRDERFRREYQAKWKVVTPREAFIRNLQWRIGTSADGSTLDLSAQDSIAKKLVERFPDAFRELTNMKTLLLWGVGLEKLVVGSKRKTRMVFLKEMSAWTSLEVLVLTGNGLTKIPEGIKKLTNLRELDLSVNDLREVDAHVFKNMTGLT